MSSDSNSAGNAGLKLLPVESQPTTALLKDNKASDPQRSEVPKSRRFRIDDRYIAPVFITLILIAGYFTYGVLDLPKTLLAIATSIAMELVLGRMFLGKWPHLASAYISGISVGILVRSPFFWPYALCSAISITSKYVLRVNGRHLWNPSNLGIVCLLLLAPQFASTLSIQFDNSIWAMLVIWAIGSIIIYRLKRFHICLTYAISFIGYAFLRHLITHDAFAAEVAPITGPMYQLFTFFMITDPKTTVKSKKGQILVTFLIATLENIFRLMGHGMLTGRAIILATHAPYFALTIVGPIANLVDIWQNKRKAAPKDGR
jgi:Na+-translocating ferredoxin:NAD+ oxidoreductase RnfD subunit